MSTTTSCPTTSSLKQQVLPKQLLAAFPAQGALAYSVSDFMAILSSPQTGETAKPIMPFSLKPNRNKREVHEEIANIAKEALRLSQEATSRMNGVRPIAPKGELPPLSTAGLSGTAPSSGSRSTATGPRLNKFVRRLHDMLVQEKDSGIVEWRRGLLVLHSTDTFSKEILPKYFNTRNFKTFRRQLNYYGFVHVRSFSTTGSSTTALWVNQTLAQQEPTGASQSSHDDVSSVLQLRRVEPCETSKTAEGRRVRKELAIHTVEEDLGVSARTLQMEQIRSLALRGMADGGASPLLAPTLHIHGSPQSPGSSLSTTDSSVSLPSRQRTVSWSSSKGIVPAALAESSNHNEGTSTSTRPQRTPLSDQESTSAANLLLLLAKSASATSMDVGSS